MKIILSIFLLTGLGVWAQNRPPTFSPLPPEAPAPTPAPPATNQNTALPPPVRRLLPADQGGTGTVQRPRPFPRPNPAGAATNALSGAAAAAAAAAAAGTPGPSPTDQVITPSTNAPAEEMLPPGMIDFRGADLNQVLQIYADLVNRTILRPASLAGAQIVLKTQTPLTKKEAIQALDAVLGLNGIGMINVGEKFVKAVPVAGVNMEGAPFDNLKGEQLPEMGQYVTHIVQLKYAKPTEMVPVLTPFQKMANAILPIDSSQILVLRDFTENVKRMLEMIDKIDVVIPSEFVSEVIPIKYALSSDIASALNSLSSGGGGTSVGSSGAGGGARTTTSTRGTGTGLNRPGSTGGYPGMNPGGSPFGGTGATQPGASPGGSSFTDRLQNIIKRASVSGEIVVLGQTKIISDERTNSLLIYASKEDMKIIKDIISKLDVVLAQVLIEAAVIEVDVNSSLDLGVSYIEKQPHGIGSYFSGLGAVNNNNSLSQSPLVSGATNIANSLPSGFSYLASFGNDLDVTLTAAAANSHAKILQRPRIQTSHAVPASLFVGQSRPYPTGSYYGGGSYGSYSSIQQLQIGVSLDVTPLINPDGLVVMDIHQKIDSFQGNVTIQGVGDVPITSSKEASAKVAVRDHDTIILGGLIETDTSATYSGVPLLKDIPVLGYLFRSTGKTGSRTELIVLIRPTVLPTPEVAAMAAMAEKNKMPGIRQAEKEERTEDAKSLGRMGELQKTTH